MNNFRMNNYSNPYDAGIRNTSPYYQDFQAEVIRFVQSMNLRPKTWLDAGCGTGNLALLIKKQFPDVALTLSDPSAEMLFITKDKTRDTTIRFVQSETARLPLEEASFDVISAILSHHYLPAEERKLTLSNVHRLLKPGGIYFTFEHIRPDSSQGLGLMQDYWKKFQIRNGISELMAERNMDRFDHVYFPLTLEEHFQQSRRAGFETVELFWKTCMQAGFIAIK